MRGPVPADVLARAPKAVLHDHLDGGLRPATVVELAREYGYGDLPTMDADELAHWFNRGAKRNDLVLYLETFAHTVGVMQHRDAIERVAYECAQDLAADGVVYAEVRMAPELCTEAGLTLDEVFRQVLAVAGPDRVLFGTDSSFFPRGWQQPVYDVQETTLRTIGVSLDDREKIFSGNFDRLFPVEE